MKVRLLDKREQPLPLSERVNLLKNYFKKESWLFIQLVPRHENVFNIRIGVRRLTLGRRQVMPFEQYSKQRP
ncbi:MAG: hypothetical protein AMXMBFR7_52350 [Planctomycetota bacterium]